MVTRKHSHTHSRRIKGKQEAKKFTKNICKTKSHATSVWLVIVAEYRESKDSRAIGWVDENEYFLVLYSPMPRLTVLVIRSSSDAGDIHALNYLNVYENIKISLFWPDTILSRIKCTSYAYAESMCIRHIPGIHMRYSKCLIKTGK